jgi:HEAT repeat protein
MRWLTRRQFKSKDAEVRAETVARLGAKAGPKEICLFAEALLDQNMDVRRAASRAIEMIPPSIVPQCIEALLPMLENTNFVLRKGAALSLTSLGWTSQTAEHRALFQIALGNFDDVEADPDSVEPLLNALKTGALAVQVDAARALEKLQKKIQDPRIVGALLQALKDSEANLRAAAASALGNSNDEKRINPLLKAFNDPAALVRAAAAAAIGKTGRAEFLKNFSPLLKDESFEVREAAVSELTKINSPEALDLIMSALKDRDADVRKRAVESLGKLRDPRSLGALISTLIDPESVVRHGAANVLQIINCEWRTSKEAQDAIPRLEAGLNDPEYWVREAAAKALNRIRNC